MLVLVVARVRPELLHTGLLLYGKLSHLAEIGGVSISQPVKQAVGGVCHLAGPHSG